jgi:hypothetical protein
MVTASFKNWLKGNTTMKLSSDAAVLRLLQEGLTNFDSLTDFDKKSLERLPSVCKETIIGKHGFFKITYRIPV